MSIIDQDKKNSRVSVLMSVFNGERFLSRSVESILGQSFADFEFIIVDDCSTDSTAEILAGYVEKDSRIVLVTNETNIGLTRSLNKGLKLARGEYLARQDADDISYPERLELQVAFLDEHPEVGLLGCSLEVIDENDIVINRRIPPNDHESIIAELLIKNNAIGHSTVMARLNLLRELDGYSEEMTYAQDYELWWRLSHKAKLANLPEIFVQWRDSSSSISSVKREKQLQCVLSVSLKIIKESLSSDSSFDEDAYSRFWLALHGDITYLQPDDIQRLEPLWKLLESKADNLNATVTSLNNLALELIGSRRITEALILFDIIRKRLGKPVNLSKMLIRLARAYFVKQ